MIFYEKIFSFYILLINQKSSSFPTRPKFQKKKIEISQERKYRNNRPEVFLRKNVLKICRKFAGENPCRSVISMKLLCNFIEIALRRGCSSVNFLHIFKTSFPKNTSEWLLLKIVFKVKQKSTLKDKKTKLKELWIYLWRESVAAQ